MKKTIVGALVGGIILFMWQFASWTALKLHLPAQGYTAKQDTILQTLGATLEKEGGYVLPSWPVGTSRDEVDKITQKSIGKPWASIQYHSSLEYNMGLNMARALVTNIVLVWLLIWIIGKFGNNSFSTTLTTSLIVGLIVYLNSAYTSHVWYKLFDIRAYLIDYIAMWGLTG
ncbi:MAG: hypothetical protein ACRC0I_02325, partial [Sediminibacterium sp.]